MRNPVLDLDGTVSLEGEDGPIKLTTSLTETDFARAVSLHAQQAATITRKADAWVLTHEIMAPYWLAHPDWNFGQCMEAHAQDIRKGTSQRS